MFDPRNDLHRMMKQPFPKGHHTLQIPGQDLPFGQAAITLAQVAGEVQRTVAVQPGIGQLDLVQNGPDLPSGQGGVVQVVDKPGKRLLEVNVVSMTTKITEVYVIPVLEQENAKKSSGKK